MINDGTPSGRAAGDSSLSIEEMELLGMIWDESTFG
jgi:hypothetical protein